MDYVTILFNDRASIVKTMFANLNADIQAGYNPVGASINRQIAQAQAYVYTTQDMRREYDLIITRDGERAAQRKARAYLIKHGIIG